MTYHPIDKPTEPGWYWCLQPNGRFDALEVLQGMMLTDGEPVMCIMPVGQGIIPADNLDGWYGPAIQPPQKYEAKMDYEAKGVRKRVLKDLVASIPAETQDEMKAMSDEQLQQHMMEMLKHPPATDGPTQGTVR